MDEIIEINGVKYKRIEEPIQTAKYKVGDWVKVVANKAGRSYGYVGEVVQITRVPDLRDYIREDDNGRIQAYSIGKPYVVYEDELEPAEEPKDPFDVNEGERYYYVQFDGDVTCAYFNCDFDARLRGVANACKDEEFVRQRAMHETLNRLLWKASMQAGERENKWNCNNDHYYIYRDEGADNNLQVYYNDGWKIQGVCYFPTEESAQSAIDNIVKPFMAEHPEFEW